MYYPKGGEIFGEYFKIPIMMLSDRNNSWRGVGYTEGTKEELFVFTYEKLREWIIKDYKHLKKPKKVIKEKLWY